jgi:hypothetical protein
MKFISLIIVTLLSVNATTDARADDLNSGSTVVMKTTLKQAGKDALKSIQETVDATKLALAALEATFKETSQKTVQATQN